MNPDTDKLVRQIDERIAKVIPTYLQGAAFTARKLTDTPTDSLQVVNRAYVTNNGTIRPTSSVVGQFFLDMSLAAGNGKPIWWNGIGYIDSSGTYV